MSIREDAMGNIWARWTGSDVDAGESSAILGLRASWSARKVLLLQLCSHGCSHLSHKQGLQTKTAS